jgi:histone H3/H4
MSEVEAPVVTPIKRERKRIKRSRLSKSSKHIALRRSTRDELKKPKKQRRFKHATVQKRKVMHARRSVDFMIPKRHMEVLARTKMMQFKDDLRIQKHALRLLHEGCESFLVDCGESTRDLLHVSKRKSINASIFWFGAKYHMKNLPPPTFVQSK